MKISDNKPTKRKIILDFDKNDTDILYKATMLMREINDKLKEIYDEEVNDIELVERYGQDNVFTTHYFEDFLSETDDFFDTLADFYYSIDEIEFELR